VDQQDASIGDDECDPVVEVRNRGSAEEVLEARVADHPRRVTNGLAGGERPSKHVRDTGDELRPARLRAAFQESVALGVQRGTVQRRIGGVERPGRAHGLRHVNPSETGMVAHA
jgi:hypothetical protein